MTSRVPKAGTRIRLILMPDDPDPVRPGSTGTVEGGTDLFGGTQIWVKWDNGRTLNLEVPPDTYEILPDSETTI